MDRNAAAMARHLLLAVSLLFSSAIGAASFLSTTLRIRLTEIFLSPIFNSAVTIHFGTPPPSPSLRPSSELLFEKTGPSCAKTAM
jgi:hypothetical protein